MKKIDQDPEWFLTLLDDAKSDLSESAYEKYLNKATSLYEEDQDLYLKKAIEASYVKFQGNTSAQGNTKLSLDKVVDVIRYLAASKKVTNLYKVKLMKLMCGMQMHYLTKKEDLLLLDWCTRHCQWGLFRWDIIQLLI